MMIIIYGIYDTTVAQAPRRMLLLLLCYQTLVVACVHEVTSIVALHGTGSRKCKQRELRVFSRFFIINICRKMADE